VMPTLAERITNQIANEALEFRFTGPFGGIQSELPLSAIEQLGFAEAQNFIFRKALAEVRPGYTALPNVNDLITEPINGIADFFTHLGDRVQVVITPTQLLRWDPITLVWLPIVGTLTGGDNQLFTWAVVNHKLLFCQGIDSVQEWDGISGAFANSFAANTPPNDVVPARYLIELRTHLLMADVTLGGVRYTQRTMWSRSGEPGNLDAFSAGIHDELGDLGPITGLAKLYQQGYQFHQRGIVRVTPTSIALRAFDFQPISSNKIGNICPYSLATAGEYAAFYIGKDNVYLFNGIESVPIGARPMEGNKMFGARKRIFAELKSADLNLVSGFVTTSVAGNDFNAYHLVIPGGSHWIYNIDEGNWCRQTYDKTPRVIGDFYSPGAPRWLDLIGPWSDQASSWLDLASDSPLSNMLIGFTDGTPGMVDFSNYSGTAWELRSGQLIMTDQRHNKTITRVRVVFENRGAISFGMTLRNQLCQTDFRCVDYDGLECGPLVTRIIDFKINGMYLEWKIAPHMLGSSIPLGLVEVTPYFDVSGEFKNPSSVGVSGGGGGGGVGGGGGSVGFHNLLSSAHPDTQPYTPPVSGDLITGQLSRWSRLPLGTIDQVLKSDGSNAVWGAPMPDEVFIAGSGRQTHHVRSTAANPEITIAVGDSIHDLFEANDVGKIIRVILRNPSTLEDFESTIISVTSPTQAVIADAPTITSTTGEAYWFDPSQNDTATLQAAINTRKGTLRLGKGVYVITGQLTNVRNTTKVLGAGSWRTSIVMRKTIEAPSLYFTDVMGLNLEGFSVIGPGLDSVNGGTIEIRHADFDNVQRLYVRDVYVRHLSYTGFVIKTPILTTFIDSKVEFSAGHGFHVIGGTTTDFINCYATTVIGAGFYIEEDAFMVGIQGGATETSGASVIVKGSHQITIDHHDSEDELDRVPVNAVFTPTLSVDPGGTLVAGNYFVKFCWMHGVAYGKESPESLVATTSLGNQTITATLGTVPAGVHRARVYMTPVNGGSGSEGFLEDFTVVPGTTAIYTRSTGFISVGEGPPDFWYNGHGYVVADSQRVSINNPHSRSVPILASRHFLVTDNSSEVCITRPSIVQGGVTPDYDIELTAGTADNEVVTSIAHARVLDNSTNTLKRNGATTW